MTCCGVVGVDLVMSIGVLHSLATASQLESRREARWMCLNTSRFIAHFWAVTDPAAPAPMMSTLSMAVSPVPCWSQEPGLSGECCQIQLACGVAAIAAPADQAFGDLQELFPAAGIAL